MTKYHDNKDKTPPQAERYAYLFTPTLRARQITENEAARLRSRAKHEGNRGEIRFATTVARLILLGLLLAAFVVGVWAGRKWLGFALFLGVAGCAAMPPTAAPKPTTGTLNIAADEIYGTGPIGLRSPVDGSDIILPPGDAVAFVIPPEAFACPVETID